MPRVLRCELLAGEHVTQMSAAGGALNFDPTPIRIRYSPDGVFDLLIERRPTAAGVELRVRHVKWGFATATDVGALNEEVVVPAGERAFCSPCSR